MTPRLEPARRRVHRARIALLGGGIVVFGATMALARAQYPGHHKHGVTSLSPPGAFVEVVRRNQLEAGILAPAEAPPGIGSAPS
jgi:hypothetical protein